MNVFALDNTILNQGLCVMRFLKILFKSVMYLIKNTVQNIYAVKYYCSLK